ncbi:MAG: BolA family protein [Leptospira sp.]|nr:BolA family protein [Leptospira sp.]
MELETRLERIRKIIENALHPEYLSVIDNSLAHVGHVGASPSGETHYQVRIKASSLAGLSVLAKHRKIYELLSHELKSGLHALEIDTEVDGNSV